jgi:hypothetical protein
MLSVSLWPGNFQTNGYNECNLYIKLFGAFYDVDAGATMALVSMKSIIGILVWTIICSGPACAECFVATRSGNIRSGPGLNFDVVAKLQPGEAYPYIRHGKNRPDWYCIKDRPVFDHDVQQNGTALWLEGKPSAGSEVVILKKRKDGFNLFDPNHCGLIAETLGPVEPVDAVHTSVKAIVTFQSQPVRYFPPRNDIRTQWFVHRSLGIKFYLNKECESYAAQILRRERAVEEHPEWPKAIKKAVRSGKLRRGMSLRQVRASIGEPDEVKKAGEEGAECLEWVYRHRYNLYFEDQRLTAWKPW